MLGGRAGRRLTDWVSDLAQKALGRLLFLLFLVGCGDVVAALGLLGRLLSFVGHGVSLSNICVYETMRVVRTMSAMRFDVLNWCYEIRISRRLVAKL
jgi:hypothetical protein